MSPETKRNARLSFQRQRQVFAFARRTPTSHFAIALSFTATIDFHQ